METSGNSVSAGNGNEKKPNLFNDCRAWKLINDPFLRRGLPKLYRFDGICPQNSAYNVQYMSDPRTVLPTRYWGGREHIDLPVPVFQIDDNCFGHLPAREVSFFDLNDNISPAFLADLCKKCGDYEELKIYYHPVDKRHLGIGRVIFRKVKYAKVCIDKHNGTPIMGKIVQVVLDPFGKRVKKTFHDLSTADSSTATSKDTNVALANQNRLSNNVAGSNLAASSQRYAADGNSSVSTPHNTASVIPEDPISQQRAPVPVSSAQVFEYPNNCASGMPPIQAGYAAWQPQACWPQIQTAAWPGAQPTWPTMPYANFCGTGALPPFPQQQSVAPLYENVDNAGAACWSALPRPSSQPDVGDESKKKERKPDAGKPNGANIYSTNNNNEKSSKSKDKCTPDKKRSEKSSSSTTTKYYEHDSSFGRKTTRQREHQTVEKRVVRLTTKLYRTSLHRDRSPVDERRKYSTSRKKNFYSKERDSHRRHRSFKSRSRDRDVDRPTSSSSKRDRHRSRGDDRYMHRSESRSSKRDFKLCDDGLESLSSDSIMSDDDALRRKAKDNFRKEEHGKSEERKNCSKKNETPPKSQHHSNSSKHRDKETVVVDESANQNLSVAKKDNCKSADDDDKMSLSSGSSRPSSRIATQEKPNLPTVLPPPQQMLPVAPYFSALPPNVYNPYDPNVYTAMMCAAMAVYGMPPTGQQHQPIMGPMQPQMSQHMPMSWSMPNVVDYQQPPVDRPTELPVLVDYRDPNIIRKLTVETSDRVVEDLKFVLNKDIWKKLVENSAFKSLDVWFQTQEKVNDILKPKSDSPEKSASTTSSAVCSTTVSSSLSRLFGQENSSTNSSSSFSQLFGLGLRASMPKLPSFKRKPVELSPSRRHREIEKATDDADASMPNRKATRRVSLSGSSTSSSRCPSEEKSSSEESDHEGEEHEEIGKKTSECGMESDRESDTVVKIEKRKPKPKRSNRVTSSNEEEEEEEKLMDVDNKSDVSDSSDEKSPQNLLNSMKKCAVVVDSDSDNNNVGHASTVSDESESDEEKSSDGDSSNEADSCSENTKENLETVDSDVELIAEVKPAEKVNRSVTPDNSSLSKNNERERHVRPVIDKITEELSPSKFGVYGDFIKKETDPTETKMVIDKGVYSPALYDHCYFVYANPPPSPPLTSPATVVVQPVVDETSFTVLKSLSSQKKISPHKRNSTNVRDLLNQNRAAVSIAAALTERNSEPNARTFVSSASGLDFSKPSSSKQQATVVATAALPILPARPVDVLFKRRDSFNETQILYHFVLNGLDEEDMGFIKRAYETMCTENSVSNEDWIKTTHWSSHVPTATQPPCKKRRILSDEKTVHKTGAARTEGFYRPTDKLKRKFTSASRRAIEEAVIPFNFKADDHAGKQQLQLSREARSNQRRLLSTFGDVDFLKFNQLKYRKKLIKFARSAIHGWGLFALEQIGQDEMIIEYVGEKIRLMVAEKREKHYEKMGIGSSYLFRIDNERVIDATKRGAVARFINHSCNPSCYAKIISLDGEKRIVIYSKQNIAAGEEITYDYKFPFEDVKIPCNCGAHNCRGSLN